MKSALYTLAVFLIVLTLVNCSIPSLHKLEQEINFLSKALYSDVIYNRWVLIKGVNAGLCLRTTGQKDLIRQVPCDRNDQTQHWFVEKNGEFVRIRNRSGMFIDAQWGRTNNGNPFWAWPGNFTPAQNYRLERRGQGFILRNQRSNRCLDVPWATRNNWQNMHQWDCHGGPNQQWTFESVEPESRYQLEKRSELNSRTNENVERRSQIVSKSDEVQRRSQIVSKFDEVQRRSQIVSKSDEINRVVGPGSIRRPTGLKIALAPLIPKLGGPGTGRPPRRILPQRLGGNGIGRPPRMILQQRLGGNGTGLPPRRILQQRLGGNGTGRPFIKRPLIRRLLGGPGTGRPATRINFGRRRYISKRRPTGFEITKFDLPDRKKSDKRSELVSKSEVTVSRLNIYTGKRSHIISKSNELNIPQNKGLAQPMLGLAQPMVGLARRQFAPLLPRLGGNGRGINPNLFRKRILVDDSYTIFKDVPLNQWILIKGAHSGKCLKAAHHTDITRQVECNPKDRNQLWMIEKNPRRGGEWINIKNKQGVYLDIQWGGTQNGATLWVYYQNWTPAQNFRLEKRTGSFKIINERSKKCIDVPWASKADNINIHQWDCHNGNNQNWIFEIPSQTTQKRPPMIIRKLPKLDTWGTLRIKSSGKCVTGFGHMTGVTLQPCNENEKTQQFKLVQNGKFIRIVGRDGNVFDLKFGDHRNGNTYWIYQTNWSHAQNWRFEHKQGNYFLIKTQNAEKCLDGPWSSLLHSWDCHGMAHQQFKFFALTQGPESQPRRVINGVPQPLKVDTSDVIDLDGYYQIKSINDKCIREEGPNSSPIVANCNDYNDEFFFKFERQSDGTYVIISDKGYALHGGHKNVKSKLIKNGVKHKLIVKKNGGNYQIKTRNHRCFDASGDRLRVRRCKSFKYNQIFAIIPYEKVYISRAN